MPRLAFVRGTRVGEGPRYVTFPQSARQEHGGAATDIHQTPSYRAGGGSSRGARRGADFTHPVARLFS
jgi:hypothetical protein